uniref:Putative secreted protein n=1 Tax=Ixodes ricinus TaxID=34613 RepID=A0A6B0UAN8_IXORI
MARLIASTEAAFLGFWQSLWKASAQTSLCSVVRAPTPGPGLLDISTTWSSWANSWCSSYGVPLASYALSAKNWLLWITSTCFGGSLLSR